jgi:hypothetical protein
MIDRRLAIDLRSFEQLPGMPTTGRLSIHLLGGAIGQVAEAATAHASRTAAFEIAAQGWWVDPSGDTALHQNIQP